MILLLFDSLLLLFITTNLGLLASNGLDRLSHGRMVPDLPGIFLIGVILSTIYFNIISFWLPVNYLSLIPLLALSTWIYSRNKTAYRQLFFPATSYLLLLVPVLLLLFCYWIKPSTSPDSRGYHFLAILWYEKFKVVPGLGNLHGRLAFNPASFLISAAYSLTGLTGQSIYPLNGVITFIFLLWILARVFRYKGSWAGLIYLFLLIMLFRPLLAYMSSPSSDPLVLICIAYPLIRIFELLLSGETITFSNAIVPLLVTLYAPLAKLSAYPILPALFCIFFLLPRSDRRLSRIIPLLLIAVCIYLPWLARNYILSGYFAYPVPHTDFFQSDWKIPGDMMQIDYYYGKYSARSITNTLQEFHHLQSLSFLRWFSRLLSFKWQLRAYVELFLLLTVIIDPFIWVLAYLKPHGATRPQGRLFIFWLTIYAGAWIWMVVSVDFRFGMIFLILSFIFALLALAPPGTEIMSRRKGIMASMLLLACTVYYLNGAVYLSRDTFRIEEGLSL